MSPDPPNKHADLRVHEHTFSRTTIILLPSCFFLPQLKFLYETLVCVCVCAGLLDYQGCWFRSLQASAVHPELLLLSSSLDIEDCFWEQRMRTGERAMMDSTVGVWRCVCVVY